MAAKVTGIKELIQKLKFLGERSTIERIAYRATFGSAKDMRNIAADLAPIGNTETAGELRRGFAIARMHVGSKLGYSVGVRAGRTRNKRAADDPYYWWLLEFGTRFIAPRGFMRRAFALMQTKAPAQIIAAGKKAVLDSGNRALRAFGKGGKK